MNTIHLLAIAATLIGGAASASAQVANGTDDARAIAAAQTRQQNVATAIDRPAAEVVAIGDYRAQAHQDTLQALAAQRRVAVLAYRTGVRSPAIVVQSEDSARAEAARRTGEAELAALAAETGAVTAAR